ncbi:unnamed protein product, partial [Nesidiocoris tenuis]
MHSCPKCFLAVKPLSVSILSTQSPLSAFKEYELICESYGSRPAAQVTWWKDNVELKNAIQK